MATSSDKQVCSICLDDFNTPKLIDCHHTFCLQCLEDLVNKTAKQNHFICPLCNKQITIPEGGVKMFTANFYIEDTPASSGRSKEFCSQHPIKEVEFYCKDCLDTFCSKCVITKHKGHNCLDLDLEDTKQEIRDELTSLTQHLEVNTVQLEGHSGVLKEVLSEMKSYAEIAIHNVDTQVDKCCTEIKLVGEKAKVEIEKSLIENEAKLNSLIKHATIVNNRLQLGVIHSQIVLEDASIVKVVNMIPKVRKLQIVSDCLKLDIPDLRYPWFEQVELEPLFTINQLGSFEMLVRTGTEIKPELDPMETSEEHIDSYFISKLNLKQVKEDELYDSPDHHVVQGVTWCVGVMKLGETLGLCLQLTEQGNETVKDCYVDCTFQLLNYKSDRQAVIKQGFNVRFIPGGYGCGFGVDKFIDWRRFSDPSNGFIDEDDNFKIHVTPMINKKLEVEGGGGMRM